MTKLLTVALVAALATIPNVALAEGAMHDDHMMPKAMSGMMICRPAASGEKGNAMMMAGHGAMMCKSVKAMMHDGKIVGPDLSKALTAEQVNAAWQAYLATQFTIPATPGGG